MSEQINNELENINENPSIKKQKEELIKNILLDAIRMEEIEQNEILQPVQIKNMLNVLKEEMDNSNSDIVCGNFLYITKNKKSDGTETTEAGIMVPVINAKNYSEVIGKFMRLLE